MIRCTRAVLFKNNLKYNIQQIKKYIKPEVHICIAVKADAYGHSAVLAARIAEEEGIEFLAVASVEEGMELRKAGIKARILLLSLCTPEEFCELFEYNITPLVFSKEYIREISDAADSYYEGDAEFNVHLAVDTGMGRIGCYPEEADDEALIINSTKHLRLEGVCTHFAVSDSIEEKNVEFTNSQFDAFNTAVKNIEDAGIHPKICSCGSSAALLNNEKMYCNMVRPGIITYGYYPDQITQDYLKSQNKDFDIKPVLALETKVVAIRHFPAGKSVSYGRTWICDKETDIAVLPIGYADGLLRRFSPGLEVTINGKKYPVRGRICMDQCMVDIGKDNPDVKLWDKVVIFGPEESGALTTAEDLARIGNTISYEVLTSLSKRVERFVQ